MLPLSEVEEATASAITWACVAGLSSTFGPMGIDGVLWPLAFRGLAGVAVPGTSRITTCSFPARTPGGSVDDAAGALLRVRPVARPDLAGATGTNVGSTTTPVPGIGVGEGTLVRSVDAARPLLVDLDPDDGVCDAIRP